MIPPAVRLGEVRERTVHIFKQGASGVGLPPSYGSEDVGKVNLKFLTSLNSVHLMLEDEQRDPDRTPVAEVMQRIPAWRAREKRRGLAWGAGMVAVVAGGIGGSVASATWLPAASFLGKAVGVGGMIGAIVGGAICCTMMTEAIAGLRALRRVEEHLPSWADTLAEEHRRRLRAQVPVPLPGGQPPGEISDDAGTVKVGDVRLPKNGRAAAWLPWPA